MPAAIDGWQRMGRGRSHGAGHADAAYGAGEAFALVNDRKEDGLVSGDI